MDKLASNIKILRKEARLTLEEFAEKAGVSVEIARRWEDGSLRPLTRELMVICPILHIHEDDILERDIVAEREEAGEKLKKSVDRENYNWYYGDKKEFTKHILYLTLLPLFGLLIFLVLRFLVKIPTMEEQAEAGFTQLINPWFYYILIPLFYMGIANLVYVLVNMIVKRMIRFRWWYIFWIGPVASLAIGLCIPILIFCYFYILVMTIKSRKNHD